MFGVPVVRVGRVTNVKHVSSVRPGGYPIELPTRDGSDLQALQGTSGNVASFIE